MAVQCPDKLAAEIAEAAYWAVLRGGKHAEIITHALDWYMGAVGEGRDK
jgi:hypothetical protein